MSRAVDSVAVAVSPSRHCTPSRSLNTYDPIQSNFNRIIVIVPVFSCTESQSPAPGQATVNCEQGQDSNAVHTTHNQTDLT